MAVSEFASRRPWVTLMTLFFSWKFLLLLIAASSPGPGYDTSTQILLRSTQRDGIGSYGNKRLTFSEIVVSKLTRWDAIYFTSAARWNYVFEQEWAFGWGFSRLMKLFVHVTLSESKRTTASYALAGVVLANLSHFFAILVLYNLVRTIIYNQDEAKRLAFLTAALHIISPAGLFLSAPYGESLFALLNFLGMWLYALAMNSTAKRKTDAYLVLSGIAFGAATMMRSNGLLSGVIFAADYFLLLLNLPGKRAGPRAAYVRLFFATGVAGVAVAVGFIIPQAIAYQDFCIGPRKRPWCNRLLPSIYSYVQDHYWGVGFLRYWTLSNLPLFILAAPASALLMITASSAIFDTSTLKRPPRAVTARPEHSRTLSKASAVYQDHREKHDSQRYAITCLRQLAAPQLLLAILALTNFHVQIITRISSGYPVWYFMLAYAIDKDKTWLGGWVKPKWAVRWMVVYALVQGGLFANFLPPA